MTTDPQNSENLGVLLAELELTFDRLDSPDYDTNTLPDWFSKLVTKIVNAIKAPINAIKSAISSSINSLLSSVKSILDGVVNSISKLIDGIITGVKNAVSKVVDTLRSLITDAMSSIKSFVGDLIDNVWSYIKDVVVKIGDFISSLADRIYGLIETVADKVRDFVNEVIDSVGGLIERMSAYVRSLFDDVVVYMTEIYEQVKTYLTNLFDEVVEQFTSFVTLAVEKVEQIYNHIKETVMGLIDGAKEIVLSSLEVISEYSERVIESISSMTSLINAEITPKLAVLTRYAGLPFGIGETKESISVSKDTANAFNDLFTRSGAMMAGEETPHDTLKNSGMLSSALSSVLSSLVYVMANGMMFFSAGNIANSARADVFLQKVYENAPVKEYSLSDAINLRTRKLISEEQAFLAAKRNGYDETKTNTLIRASYTHIDIERLRAAFLREHISESEFEEGCRLLGYSDSDVSTIRKIIPLLPPPQDLITMAVREAFTPSAVKEFGLEEDFPEDFAYWGEKQGISEDWSKKYWAAHWRLPSAMQGFEMYHRKVISFDQLKALLKALDIAPKWRDYLIQIAYTTITRVDIRRIYQMGIIERDEVKKLHEDIGYSPDNAEIMTKFVESYVDVDDPDADIDIKQLTYSQVRRLWGLGTINDYEAVQRLIAVEYTLDMARVLVQSWSDEETIKYREDLVKRYTRKAIRDDMDNREIEILFSDLYMTRDELRKVKQVVSIERSEYDSIPSKTELRDMFKSGYIAYEDWFSSMRKHGYSSYWIENYFNLFKLGGEADGG